MELPAGNIAAAADANFVAHATWAAQNAAGMRTWLQPMLTLVDSGLACDTFNIACCARLPGSGAEQHIQTALDFFAAGTNLFSWWVGPADRPQWLGELLLDAGLARAESELAMALSLAELPALLQPIDGLEIRRVTTVDQLEVFALTVTPDAEAARFYRLTAEAILTSACPQWFYVGYAEGTPVATIEATLAGGVAGLYNITTRTEWRGRGIATAMTLHVLKEAHRGGAGAAVLQAAAAGIGLYQRLGFKTFGEIVEYKPIV